MNLHDVLNALNGLPAAERQAVVKDVMEATKGLTFIPSPGPQTKAYFSQADILLYGGEPGGGKTALGVGLSLNEHTRSLLVRKNFVDLDGVLHALDNIVGKPNCAKGGNRPYYETQDERMLDFMGLGDNIDGKQGNPHDLIYVDEAAQIPEQAFRMLLGWLRTTVEGQRCRVVLGSNPPLDSTGDWLIDYFGPWLDDRHPNPAEDGELRWFLPNDGDDGFRECEEGEAAIIHGLEVKAHSRTFIRSKVTDNPYLDPAEYGKALSNLPKEMRDRLMSGNFMASREDPPWQAIPTAWVKAAQERWTASPPPGVPQCAMGVDVAQGGSDKTVIARRYDWWFAALIEEPGKSTPGGTDVAALVIKHRHDSSKVIIDVGGGWGASAHGHLMKNQVDSLPYMGVKDSTRRTADNQLSFVNVRTEAYWRLREALDPDQLGGSSIALPPDRVLMSDLTSPTYRITAKGIELEPKLKVVERLKRSTDKGDAVVMAWYSGSKAATDWHSWPAGQQSWRTGRPTVNLGHSAARRKK